MSAELKPCPFCGNVPGPVLFAVQDNALACNHCGARGPVPGRGPITGSERCATNEWNRRPPPATSSTAGDAERAFEIADEAMFEILLAHGIERPGDCIEMRTAKNGWAESFADADEPIREAFEWLQPRGYVALAKGGMGEYIKVLRRPPIGKE